MQKIVYKHALMPKLKMTKKNKPLFTFVGEKGPNKEIELSNLEIELMSSIKKAKLSPEEAGKVLKNLKQIAPKKYTTKKIDFGEKEVLFGGFSDCHMGSMDYRPDVFRKMIKDGKKQGVEFYVNSGDTIEGMSNREGHVFQLTHLGADAQFDYFKDEFKHFNKPVYSLEAQDSHGGWMHSKSNMGLDIGKELELRETNYDFIGYDEQDIKLDNGLKIRLRHPGGGTAYAISYKMQKYIESIGGGDKPNILFQGHFHKMEQLFYRNIHGFDAGCLQNQSPFMKKVGTPAHVGYWIIKARMHKIKSKGVERIISQFIPFYD